MDSTERYFSISEDAGCVAIKIKTEEFSYECHNEFRSIYNDRQGGYRYVVDFGMVRHIDSSVLGMLLILTHHNEYGQNVKLINCNETVTKMLEMAHFNELFDIS